MPAAGIDTAPPPLHNGPMRFIVLIAAVFALTACIVEDVASIQMEPRPQPQTQSEIAFMSALFNDIQLPSFEQDREFCGLIGVDAAGNYVATKAIRGREATCLPPDPDFADFTVLASYHTHGSHNDEYFNEVPSFDDMRTDIEDGTDGYGSTGVDDKFVFLDDPIPVGGKREGLILYIVLDHDEEPVEEEAIYGMDAIIRNLKTLDVKYWDLPIYDCRTQEGWMLFDRGDE